MAPYAPTADARSGGGRAVHGLVHNLALRHEVMLVHLDRFEIDPVVAQACAGVNSIDLSDPGPWGVRRRGASALLRGRSLKAAASAVDELKSCVSDLAVTFRPDVVQVESGVLGDVLAAVRGPLRVLTIYEPAESVGEDLARRRRSLPLTHRLDTRAAAREERRALGLADVVVAFTERDRRLLARTAPPRTRVECIPLAGDLPPTALDPAGSGPPTLLFVGNFIHPPNVEAALRLGRRIFPLVVQAQPAARLQLVGISPPPELLALQDDRVTVTGEVPAVTPYLDQAAVVMAPIATGGGMRVKVLEALGAGKAVVASSRAMEGINARAGEDFILADTDEEAAAAALHLLADEPGRRAMGIRARAWAEGALSWSAMADRYDEIYARPVRPRA